MHVVYLVVFIVAWRLDQRTDRGYLSALLLQLKAGDKLAAASRALPKYRGMFTIRELISREHVLVSHSDPSVNHQPLEGSNSSRNDGDEHTRSSVKYETVEPSSPFARTLISTFEGCSSVSRIFHYRVLYVLISFFCDVSMKERPMCFG